MRWPLEALDDALYDSQAMRTFAGIDLSVEAVPDATTLLAFRHLLEAHALTQRRERRKRAAITSSPPLPALRPASLSFHSSSTVPSMPLKTAAAQPSAPTPP